MKKEKKTEAVKALEALLMECHPKPKPTEVSVYTYDMQGLRVAEISFVWKPGLGGATMSGASSMRSEMPQLILAAEEFLVTHDIPAHRPTGWDSDIDIHAEAADHVRGFMRE